ncbi:MAG: bifunctional (p)ppGpp synthetase/guanosine-3',5'-bis(diphosphate) 3'-pyrophosphohydrolase [Alphaproteobacteria bacterium]|nr:bifunctional (p)ppGpp synthetase/guanosine-3',5'-bis(diphosphate) 3'-pyrophosphohydrolase [Alphaproteobacteria bacterium]
MIHQYDLVQLIKAYDPNVDESLINKAYQFALEAHGSQKRASGDLYFSHPIEVAALLTEMKLDSASIITALLHDTVEDTKITLEDIKTEFGEEIAQLVDGVTKLTKIKYQPEHIRQAENFRKLLLAMSEDIRVLLVKLADRLHNMRTLKYVKSPDKRRRIALETMEIYAPLAERIGIQQIKNELQDLAFAELYPEIRQSIVNRFDYLRQQGNVVVERVINRISKVLDNQGISAQVYGREKTPYSIWKKMEQKNVSFEQLSDIIGFRIIVKNLEDCYRALGVIHTHFHTVPNSFRDFISTPKTNGYQSLHTVVMGPERQAIEIQIRTEEMHEIAELGVAAHWSYKTGTTNKEGKQYRWVRELLHILENATDSQEFLENTKLEMYYDHVFCFTPRGDVIMLPVGSTPVDFAYAVHSDIGNSCVGSKVNSRVVPLNTELKNGDQVEIIRSKNQVPSPGWLDFAVTGKAKTEIKRYIKDQQKSEYVKLGIAIIKKILAEQNIEFNDTIIEPLLHIFSRKTLDDLYSAIGDGSISHSELSTGLFPNKKPLAKRKSAFSLLRFKDKTDKKESAISLKGLVPGMAIHFAKCCHPLPGDEIIGITNAGKGITIHTTDCEALEAFANNPEQLVDVSWEKQSNDEIHIGRIRVVLSHEAGSLATLAMSVYKGLGNIRNLKITHRSHDFFEMILDIEVRGAGHLNNIMAALRSETCIYSVERVRGSKN